MAHLSNYLIHSAEREQWDESLLKHWDWFLELKEKYPSITRENVNEILEVEVGAKFQRVLEHTGVFKQTSKGKAAFLKFLQSLETK